MNLPRMAFRFRYSRIIPHDSQNAGFFRTAVRHYRRAYVVGWLLVHTPAWPHEDIKEDIQVPLDIRAPGSDLANFPNSAFTLPKGGFYLESSPVTYTSRSSTLAAEYNFEYLLRYGLLDWLELRLYSQGFSVQGNPQSATGFSPLTFDSKVHLWDELEDYYLPAVGLEVTLQTNLLGSSAFNSGLEPSFSVNFDQGLPWDIDIEYNLGAARFEDPQNLDTQVWDVTFAWAIQKEVIPDVAVFINGYYNAANLPRIGRLSDTWVTVCPVPGVPCRVEEQVRQGISGGGQNKQYAMGLGGIWTLNDKVSLFTNLAGGLTEATPSFTSFLGFAWTP